MDNTILINDIKNINKDRTKGCNIKQIVTRLNNTRT